MLGPTHCASARRACQFAPRRRGAARGAATHHSGFRHVVVEHLHAAAEARDEPEALQQLGRAAAKRRRHAHGMGGARGELAAAQPLLAVVLRSSGVATRRSAATAQGGGGGGVGGLD